MKSLLLLVIFFISLSFGQDSLKVSKDDWNFLRQTYNEVDSALTDCEDLNNLYEDRMTEFQMQVQDLLDANGVADSIIYKKNIQLEKRKEQVRILNNALNKKRVEIWMYRSGGIIIIIGVGILFTKI